MLGDQEKCEDQGLYQIAKDTLSRSLYTVLGIDYSILHADSILLSTMYCLRSHQNQYAYP